MLEVELQRELNDSRIKGVGDFAKVTPKVVHVGPAIDGISTELCVVPNVEELRAELQVASPRFAEYEVLEEGYVPVVSARAPHGVPWCVAPRAWSWRRIDGSVEPLFDGVWIMTCAGPVGTVRGVRDDAGDAVPAQADVHRCSRAHSDDTGDFPSAYHRLRQLVIAVLHEWQVVNEVGKEDIVVVVRRWPEVVLPTRVGVGYIA